MQEDHYFAVLEKRLKFAKNLASCERDLETVAKELAQHRCELQAIKRSLSWRMTAPLRTVADLLRKWRGSRIDRDAAAAIRNSELFDPGWYLLRYPDIAARGLDPAMHYLQFGANEGRDPGPGFDTKWYRGTNPDVMQSGVNPLIHYIRHGQAERRLPMP